MLDEGRYGSVTDRAAGEKLDRGYLGRILMLTLLAPDIVEAILDGRQPPELGVHVLREGFPVEWGEQRDMFARCLLPDSRELATFLSVQSLRNTWTPS